MWAKFRSRHKQDEDTMNKSHCYPPVGLDYILDLFEVEELTIGNS